MFFASHDEVPARIVSRRAGAHYGPIHLGADILRDAPEHRFVLQARRKAVNLRICDIGRKPASSSHESRG